MFGPNQAQTIAQARWVLLQSLAKQSPVALECADATQLPHKISPWEHSLLLQHCTESGEANVLLVPTLFFVTSAAARAVCAAAVAGH